MDTSPEYIKMCDCPEIQGQRTPERVNSVCIDGKWETTRSTGNWGLGDWLLVQTERGDTLVMVLGDSDVGGPREYSGGLPSLAYEPTEYDCDDNCTRIVWLPRQDQLQEMTAAKGWVAQLILLWHETDADYWGQFRTWEQLWLAFVMQEKHNKHWTGEAWE